MLKPTVTFQLDVLLIEPPSLTGVTALAGGARVVVASGRGCVLNGGEVAGARVVRAECLATLVHLTRIAVALYLERVGNWCKATGAANGVAVFLVGVLLVVVLVATIH